VLGRNTVATDQNARGKKMLEHFSLSHDVSVFRSTHVKD
jgi:hypothetical protein